MVGRAVRVEFDNYLFGVVVMSEEGVEAVELGWRWEGEE